MVRTTQAYILVASALLLTATAIHAAATPEQTCQKGRHSAAAQYSACQQKALAKRFEGNDADKFVAASGKCQRKYTAVWPKLQAKAPGSTCDTNRFTDNGTTVTDNLTGLQWEKKTDDATIHDADFTFMWSAGTTAADGSVFTSFLSTLNSGGCFAGQCDWRLPALLEFQTILLEPYPCTTSPCSDPLFGPGSGGWSATTYATSPDLVWLVSFSSGDLYTVNKHGFTYVRAVRAGLF